MPEETTKVAEVAVEAVKEVKGNLWIVVGTAAGTIALIAGVKYGIKGVKKLAENRKHKKEKLTETAPEA